MTAYTEIVSGEKLLNAWVNYSGSIDRLLSNNGISEQDIDKNARYECEWPEHCTRRSLTDSEMMIRAI